MHDKRDISRVDVLHEIGKLPFVPSVIRHVADEREVKSGTLQFPSPQDGGATRKEQYAA
jgi:hypothetical protein